MSKAVRVTISIPGDLKVRMDAVEEPTNWSAVAARAFDDRLADIASRKKVSTMNDVVERLRASKRAGENEARARGREAGREWAKASAEAIELQRIEQDRDDALGARLEWPDECYPAETNCAFSAIELLAFMILGDESSVRGRAAATEFWAIAVGDLDPIAVGNESEFACGFAEGALEVWAEVKDAL